MSINIGDYVYDSEYKIYGHVCSIYQSVMICVDKPANFRGHNGRDAEFHKCDARFYKRNKMWWVDPSNVTVIRHLDENLI